MAVPIKYEYNAAPNIIIKQHKVYSLLAPVVTSPYPTVVRVYTAQWKATKYLISDSASRRSFPCIQLPSGKSFK